MRFLQKPKTRPEVVMRQTQRLMQEFPWIWAVMSKWDFWRTSIVTVKTVEEKDFLYAYNQSTSQIWVHETWRGDFELVEACHEVKASPNKPERVSTILGRCNPYHIIRHFAVVHYANGPLSSVVIYRPPKGYRSLNDMIRESVQTCER